MAHTNPAVIVDGNKKLFVQKHVEFIKTHDKNKEEDFAYWMSEHLRVSGFYWGLCAMAGMGALDRMPRDEILSFVQSAQHSDGKWPPSCSFHLVCSFIFFFLSSF